MKIINHTSIPTEELKALVKWVCPVGLRLSEVSRIEFVNSNWFAGLAHRSDGRVKIKVPPYRKLNRPDVWGGRNGYLRKSYYSWEELLVGITAHELRHIQQFKNNGRRFRDGWITTKPESEWSLYKGVKKIRRYNLGTNGKLIEVDASLYEMRKVREYRRTNISFIKTKQ
jgi:hypothetical protein